MIKKIVFVTGTRADYGKIKSIIKISQNLKKFKIYLFVTGMHNLKILGKTSDEIFKDNIKNIFVFDNKCWESPIDEIMIKTISGFKEFVLKVKPDLIIVHGDRVETLACAITGSLNMIRVAHIEGGEVSGTIDELIRHSVSKLSHIHFVSNSKAKKRLLQMGEEKKNIFIIGSPDVDYILRKDLPSISQVKKRYDIKFLEYGICIVHPVTTDIKNIKKNIRKLIAEILISRKNFVFIYPNNDSGSEIIMKEFYKLKNNSRIKLIPSMRFEYYLSLLKNSNFLIGNSSSGIIEAPYYGVPTLNIGNRQNKRAKIDSIINVDFDRVKIANLLKKFFKKKIRFKKNKYFGTGNSNKKFIKILKNNHIWETNRQKTFVDYEVSKK